MQAQQLCVCVCCCRSLLHKPQGPAIAAVANALTDIQCQGLPNSACLKHNRIVAPEIKQQTPMQCPGTKQQSLHEPPLLPTGSTNRVSCCAVIKHTQLTQPCFLSRDATQPPPTPPQPPQQPNKKPKTGWAATAAHAVCTSTPHVVSTPQAPASCVVTPR